MVGRSGGSIYPPHNGKVTRPSAAEDPASFQRGWILRYSNGRAGPFHDRDPDPDTGHELWLHTLDRPAVIFGSTQLRSSLRLEPDDGDGDGASTSGASGVEVCRRRSGGGLVIVRPGDVWVDAVVPRHSPLHHDDIGRAFDWFGRVWLDALRAVLERAGVDGDRLHLAVPPPGRRGTARPFFCFADIGHGEVMYGDRKVVGISQRRTRNWTRLQSLLVTSWDPTANDGIVSEALIRLGRGDLDRKDLGGPPYDAAGVKAGFTGDAMTSTIDPDTVVGAVVERLPILTGSG